MNMIQTTQPTFGALPVHIAPAKKLKDQELVNLCKQNDPKAQRLVYEKYFQTMLHTCIRYIPDTLEAEDALIEGFAKVFSKIHLFDYRGKGSFSGWIKRIMVNECLMILRRKNYEKVDIDNLIKLDSQQQTDDSILYEELIQLMYQLPKGYRTVFNLYVIEGYSHKEIGEKLGISENTSKSQLSKARASLIKSLKRHDI